MGKWRTQSDQLPTPTTLSGCAAWECCSNLRLHPIQLTLILLLLIFFFYLFIYSCNELCIVLYCIVLYCIEYLFKEKKIIIITRIASEERGKYEKRKGKQRKKEAMKNK